MNIVIASDVISRITDNYYLKISLPLFFGILILVNFYIAKRKGQDFSWRYDNTLFGKIIKFFLIAFIFIVSLLFIFLLSVWLGFVKI